MNSAPCQYVRDHYGVPAEIGRRVLAYGKPGVIAEDRGHYIGVNLDGDKPGTVRNYHPTDGVEYLEMDCRSDRLANGNAWMMCSECGAKLYDFDGHRDSSRPCPYLRNGVCEPK